MLGVPGAIIGPLLLLSAQSPVAPSPDELDARRMAAGKLELVHAARLPSLSAPEYQVRAMRWSLDGARLAVGWKEGVGIVEVATGKYELRSLGLGRVLGADAGGWLWLQQRDMSVLRLSADPAVDPVACWQGVFGANQWIRIDGDVGFTGDCLHRPGAPPRGVRLGSGAVGEVAHDFERGRLLLAMNGHEMGFGAFHCGLYLHELASGETRALGAMRPPGERPLMRPLGSVEFALDGRTAFAAGATLRSFDVAAATLSAEVAVPQQFFAVVDALLAIGHDGKQFMWWNCRTLTVGKVEPLPTGAVVDIPVRCCTALSPRRDLLALVVDRDLWIWRIRLDG